MKNFMDMLKDYIVKENNRNIEFEKAVELYKEATQALYKSRSDWSGNILIAASGLFGALIALTNNTGESALVRYSFVVSLALIILGILFLTIALRFDTIYYKRCYKVVRENVIDKLRGGSNSFFVSPPTYILIFEKISWVFFILSLIILMFYVIAKNLPEIFCNCIF